MWTVKLVGRQETRDPSIVPSVLQVRGFEEFQEILESSEMMKPFISVYFFINMNLHFAVLWEFPPVTYEYVTVLVLHKFRIPGNVRCGDFK